MLLIVPMFDFEKLSVYQKAKLLNKEILNFCKNNSINPYIKNQLSRASISFVINIAEGSGKFSWPDKRNFYTISRGSIYECVSLFEIIKDNNKIEDSEFQYFYGKLEEVSKMLLGLIRSRNENK
jgi:four helix bundle protein